VGDSVESTNSSVWAHSHAGCFFSNSPTTPSRQKAVSPVQKLNARPLCGLPPATHPAPLPILLLLLQTSCFPTGEGFRPRIAHTHTQTHPPSLLHSNHPPTHPVCCINNDQPPCAETTNERLEVAAERFHGNRHTHTHRKAGRYYLDILHYTYTPAHPDE